MSTYLSWKQLSECRGSIRRRRWTSIIEKKIQNKVENANFCATNPALELYFSLNFHRFLCKCMFRGFFSVYLVFPTQKTPLMIFCFQIFSCFCEVISGLVWSVIALWLHSEWIMSWFILLRNFQISICVSVPK